MAQKYWKEIPEHFLFIRLDEFVIMPNHIHGILIIEKGLDCINSSRSNLNVETLHCNVSTDEKNDYYRRISPKTGTLSTVIRSYKSVCTKNIKKFKADFAWQDNFYDRIVREEKELDNIKQYIYNNPLKWGEDENFCR